VLVTTKLLPEVFTQTISQHHAGSWVLWRLHTHTLLRMSCLQSAHSYTQTIDGHHPWQS